MILLEVINLGSVITSVDMSMSDLFELRSIVPKCNTMVFGLFTVAPRNEFTKASSF